ncbi:ABC transporter permease [Acidobacterium sp. S8]|uniref:ABC transporter permease n=1 Tax=Acidobacterium sp. S8 TaxID=1641854 RepID=UPI0020B173EF|nr:ABC transporter permease [Acidobacterium sp. S8]
MPWFQKLFSRRRIYNDLSEEIRQHLDEKVEFLVAEGMSRSDAEHQARREFGNVTLLEEHGREAWQWPAMNSLWADVRFGLRQIGRYRAFTIMAVTTLALGIGANTAIFTLIDSIMLRPLPFPQQERLMRISGVFPKGWIRELQNRAESFTSITGYGPHAESNIEDKDAAERVFGSSVMVNAFDTLDIHPALGSFFSPDNAIAGQNLVTVLNYGYWQQRFAGNPQVIGQTIRIDGISRKIIGVMPAGINFPYTDTQFVIPISFKGGDTFDPWKDFGNRSIGRLRDGVTPAAAQAELRRLHPHLLPLFPWVMPDSWEADTTVTPLLDSVIGDTGPRLLLLFGAVGLILLIACANVANLMLARAVSREREMAIRGALGASGWRIVRQLLVESILLGILAGIAGLSAASLSLRVLTRLLPADTPRVADIAMHWDVFLFAAIASVLTGVIFGLVPAIKMASPHLQSALRSGGISVAGKGSQYKLSMLLVVGQIGLSVVVITAAGLMLHSLYSLSRVNPGFRTEQILTAEVSLDSSACKQSGYCHSFFQQLEQKAHTIARTEDVALVDKLPMTGSDLNYVYDSEGNPRSPRQIAGQAAGRIISTNYFQTIGLRLLRGRLLTDSDQSGASRAIVINQKMARSLWPNQDPIGKHIIEVADEPTPATLDLNAASIVVGVVSNTHHDSLASNFDEEVYLPMTRSNEQPQMTILLRSHLPATQLTSGLRRAAAELDPLVPVTHVRSLGEVVAASASTPRSLAILLLGFGALAVGVGSVGVYSLIAYVVSWRRREIGIRIALGAPRWQIVQAVVKQSLLLSIAGSITGLAGAIVSASLLRNFLFQVSPFDPLTFCAVPLLMIILALIAAWAPARRAASIDPMLTLRGE